MRHLPEDSNFLKIDDDCFCSYADSRFVLYGAPYEHTSSYHKGSAKGPAAMIDASQFVELFDEETDREPYRSAGICTVAPLDFAGKVDEEAIKLIEERTARILKDGKFPVMLGAEHTVTLGAVRAVQAKHPSVCVLQIDAHSDLRDSYNDNRYSHASVMARVHDLKVPLVQVAIRAQCKEEAELRKRSKSIHTLYAYQLKSRPTAEWIAEVVSKLGKDVYITIDADGLDPSIVPAVGTAEPNGLTWLETVELLRAVTAATNIVGFDVVEVAPKEGSTLSEYVMAKLVYKLIGFLIPR